MSSSPAPRSSVERQLFSNQVWETAAFAAKAAFMLGLTPWMLRAWGARGYGEFALASSAFVLLSILDFGIRGHTRLALCRPESSSPDEASKVLGQSVFTFSIVGLSAAAISVILTALGAFEGVFQISSGNEYLLAITTAMTMLVLLSGLMLEPLVAAGEIGRVKLATAAGWLLATPVVAAVLWRAGGVTLAVVMWLGCLFCTNMIAVASGGLRIGRCSGGKGSGAGLIRNILRQGVWFNATNATWLARTYGATLLISAVDGPSSAGAFFILLRLSEIISGLGAISCDVSLGQLAQSKTAEQRQRSFRSTYSWAVLLCLHGAIIIGFLTPEFYAVWLRPASQPSPLLGGVVVALGLGSALNRTATYAAMGLGIGKTAALWGAVEAMIFTAVLLFSYQNDSLPQRLAWASLAAFALFPLVHAVSRSLSMRTAEAWLRPIVPMLPAAAASAAVLLIASWIGYPVLKLTAIAICTGIFLWQFVLGKRTACSYPTTAAAAPSQMPC